MHFSLGLFAFDLSYIIKRAKKGGENVSYFKKGGGKMRKVVSLLISLVVMVSCLSVCASAYDTVNSENVIVRDIASAQKSSMLNIDGSNTANCKSSFVDSNSNIYSVKAEQTLEKHWAFGVFFAVDGANWENTVYTDNLSMTNYKNNLDSGTYRLKTVFTVTLIGGQTETIDVYSSEKTIF